MFVKRKFKETFREESLIYFFSLFQNSLYSEVQVLVIILIIYLLISSSLVNIQYSDLISHCTDKYFIKVNLLKYIYLIKEDESLLPEGGPYSVLFSFVLICVFSKVLLEQRK